MKEQSHKAEMSAALRGDFERLRARGVSAALVPQDEAEQDEASPDLDSESGGVAGERPETLEGTSADAAPAEREDEPPVRRGWLSRFGGR